MLHRKPSCHLQEPFAGQMGDRPHPGRGVVVPPRLSPQQRRQIGHPTRRMIGPDGQRLRREAEQRDGGKIPFGIIGQVVEHRRIDTVGGERWPAARHARRVWRGAPPPPPPLRRRRGGSPPPPPRRACGRAVPGSHGPAHPWFPRSERHHKGDATRGERPLRPGRDGGAEQGQGQEGTAGQRRAAHHAEAPHIRRHSRPE